MEATTIPRSVGSRGVPIGKEDIHTRTGVVANEKTDARSGIMRVKLTRGEIELGYSVIKEGDGPRVIQVDDITLPMLNDVMIETERPAIESLAAALIDVEMREGAENIWHYAQAPWLAPYLNLALRAALLRQED